jgi:hypothetical protein
MVLHIVAIIAVLFLISVFFYKYSPSPSDIRLIQIEWGQIETWPELRTEGQPVIIRGAPTSVSPVWTSADLIERDLALPHQVLINTRESTKVVKQHLIDKWIASWFPQAYTGSPVLEHLAIFNYQAITGPQPIHKTTSVSTVIAPTDGEMVVSIAMPAVADFLPINWNTGFPQLTKADTPFVGNIKYIDIILRPGTMLALPCHWYYSIDTPAEAFSLLIECHSPISYFASKTLKR